MITYPGRGNHWDYFLSNVLNQDRTHGDYDWEEKTFIQERALEVGKGLNIVKLRCTFLSMLN